MSTILDSLKKSSDKRGNTTNNSIDSFSFNDSKQASFFKFFAIIAIIFIITLSIVYYGYRYLYPDDNFTQNPIAPNSNESIVSNTAPIEKSSNDKIRLEKPNSDEVKERISAIHEKQKAEDNRQTSRQTSTDKQKHNDVIGQKSNVNNFQDQQKPPAANNETKVEIETETRTNNLDEKRNAKIATVKNQTDTNTKTSKKSYLYAYQLPFSIRKDLPELKLNIHIYDANPQNRIAIINGEKFEIDTLVVDEVLLKEIVSEGVVLEFKQTEFLLPKL